MGEGQGALPFKNLASLGSCGASIILPMEQALTWACVKSDIVVEELADLLTSGSWMTCEAELMLMELR